MCLFVFKKTHTHLWLLRKGNICIGCQFSDLGFFLRTCWFCSCHHALSDESIHRRTQRQHPKMSLVSEQEVVPSFSGAVSIFESAHAFENIVTLIWKPNYENLARHIETCSVDSRNKIQSLQNKNTNCIKLQLQKHKMNINLNSTCQTMKVSRKHPRKIEAWHQHWLMKQDPPGSYPEWWSRQVRKSGVPQQQMWGLFAM